jgi:hypothetical protein
MRDTGEEESEVLSTFETLMEQKLSVKKCGEGELVEGYRGL